MSYGLFKFVFISRIILLSLQVLLNISIPDHNADAFRLPRIRNESFFDKIVFFLLGGFSRWDAQYFLHIAQYGYTYENTLVFFPLFPLLLRFTSNILELFTSSFLSPFSFLLITGVIFNNICFLLSALFLYKLTLAVFNSKSLAHIVIGLYCINPASIFFVALYSESLFALFTFAGLWALETNKPFLAFVSLSMSSLTRSNGVISVCFILHNQIKQMLNCQSNELLGSILSNCLKICHKVIIKTVFICCGFLLPFISFQIYNYLLYCTQSIPKNDVPEIIKEHAIENSLKLNSEFIEWCNWSIPFSYSYVQSHYWNVGFLHYYTLKKIPNFLLAFPVLVSVAIFSFKYFKLNKNQFKHLGLNTSLSKKSFTVNDNGYCFPYFIHIAALAVFCLFYIHVEVTTRLICSSSPVLYWMVGSILLPEDSVKLKKVENSLKRRSTLSDEIKFFVHSFSRSQTLGKLCVAYFLCYFVIGTLLHVNFLPWT